MANDLTLSVKLTGDGKQLSGTLKDAQGEVRAFGGTTEREGGRAEQALERTGRQAQTVSGHLNKLRTVALGVGAGLAALGGMSFVRGMLDESEQLETNLLRTQQLLETTGRAGERTAEQMHQQARELALGTLESTEGIMAAQQTLLTFRNVAGDTFDEATKAALDMSAALGTDLNSSILQLGKALEDPVTGMTALSRSGTVFTESQKEMVKELVETNHTAEAQAFILAELSAQYGGVAAAEAQGLTGAQDTLGQKLQEVKIELGAQLNLVERSTGFYNTASAGVQFLTDNMGLAVDITKGLATVAGTTAVVALGRYTAAQVTANAAMFTGAGAARALTGAMTLLGGPIGLLIGAGGLLYAFRDELGLADIALNDVGKSAAKTDIALNNLSAAVDDSAEAALDANYQELTRELFNVGRSAAAARVELAELEAEQNNRRTEQTNSRGVRAIGPNGPEQGLIDATRVNRAREALEKYEAQENRLMEGMAQNDAARAAAAAARAERDKVRSAGIQRASDLLDGNTGSTNTNTGSTKANAAANETAAKAASELAKNYQTLYDRLNPLQAAQRTYAQELATIVTWGKQVGMTTGEIAEQVRLLNDEWVESQNKTTDLADNTVKAAYTMEGAWDEVRLNGLRRLDDGLASLWENAIDGSLNAGELMKKALAQTLAEMAHMAITRPITVQLANSMGLNGGAGGGAGGAGGMLSGGQGGISSFSGALDAVSSGFGNIAWTGAQPAINPALGMQGGISSGALQGANSAVGGANVGFLGGSTSNFSGATGFASAGAGMAGSIAGTALGESMFDRTAGSNYGATAGSLAGTYVGGPIGAAIGGAIGGAIDARFGGSNRTYLSAITSADEDDAQSRYGGFESNTVENRQSALGMVGFSDWGTYSPQKTLGEGGLEKVIEGMIQNDALVASVAQTEEELEAMREAAQGFNVNATSSEELMKGLGERNKTVLATLQGDFGEFVQALDGSIDQIAAQAQQATASHALLTDASERMGLQFDAAADGAIHYAFSLQEAVGGVDALNNMSASYYQNYFTASEREAMQREDLTRTMQELGFELPKTRAGFRELMEAQNLNTTAGVQNAAALMQLEGAFAQLVPAINDAGDAAKSTSAVLQERAQLERELLRAQGDTAAIRQLELSEIDKSNQALQQSIWAIQDAEKAEQERARAQVERQRELDRQAQESARAAEEAARAYQQSVTTAKQAVQQAYQRFDQQQFDLQLNYLELLGDGEQALAMQRARELQTIDESLRPFQERLWALQDEAAAQQQAREASRNYVSELERVRGELSGAMGNINGWIDQRQSTSGTPEMNLASAQEQLARQLVLAENGDRDALQGITQYADRVLQANDAYNASSSAGQRVESDVIKALQDLPKALSAEEFLAKEITDKLDEVITSFDDMIRLSLADEIERAVFASQYTIGTLIDFAVGSNDLPEDLRTVLGNQAHRLDSTINYLIGTNELDKDDRALALNVSNNLVSTVDQLLGSELNWADKRLALNTTNTLSSTVDLTLGSDVSKETRKLALLNSNTLVATIDAIQSGSITADTRALALNHTNAISTHVNALMASSINDNAKKLALSKTNTLTTTIKAALADGALSRDERRLIDTQSETVVKTLKTSGGLSLNRDEWAVINAASGTQRLQLLADVAFGRADLDELGKIKKNTEDGGKSIGQRASEQLTALGEVAASMSATATSIIGLNNSVSGLAQAIADFETVQKHLRNVESGGSSGSSSSQSNTELTAPPGSPQPESKPSPKPKPEPTPDPFVGTHSSGYRYRESEQAAMDYIENHSLLDIIRSSRGYTIKYDPGFGSKGFAAISGGLNSAANMLRATDVPSMPRFARGGWTGPGGKWDPAGIVHAEEFVVRREVVKQPGVRGMLEALNSGQAGSTPTPRATPLPSYPLLANSDIGETLRDLKREVAELRRENARLQGESNKHLAAANTQRGAAATGQISAIERGNRMLKRMENDQRLEAAKR